MQISRHRQAPLHLTPALLHFPLSFLFSPPSLSSVPAVAIKVSLQSCTIKDVEGGTPEEVKRPHPAWVGNINMEHTGFVFLPELGSMSLARCKVT